MSRQTKYTCDRCGDKGDGSQLVLGGDATKPGMAWDLCVSCVNQFGHWLAEGLADGHPVRVVMDLAQKVKPEG